MKKNIIVKLSAGLFTAACLVGCSNNPNYAVDATAPRSTDYSYIEEKSSPASLKTAFKQESFYFKLNDSSKLTGRSDSLSVIANKLKTDGLKVNIEGHADERGSDKYNYKLAEKRAHFIANQLESLGAPKKSLNVVSYGKSRPLVNGHNETSWKVNRRVDIVEKS